jgi:ribosomal protein S18 acetylase RimI-like enzyme
MPTDTTAEIRVRAATLADSVNVTKFCLKADAWGGRSGRTDEKRVYQFVFGLISMGLVAIADLSGNVVGSIGVLAIQPSHTEEWSVYVDWLKVQSHLKDSGAAQSLLRFALRFAKKRNSNLLLNLSHTDLEQIGVEYLRSVGFETGTQMLVRKADAIEQPRADQSAKPAAEPAGAGAAEPVVSDTAGGTVAEDPAAVPAVEPRVLPAEPAKPAEDKPRSRFRLADGPTAGQLAAKRFAERRAARAAPT